MQSHTNLDIAQSNSVYNWLAGVQPQDDPNCVEPHSARPRQHRDECREPLNNSDFLQTNLSFRSQRRRSTHRDDDGLQLAGQSTPNPFPAEPPPDLLPLETQHRPRFENGRDAELNQNTVDPYSAKTYGRKPRRKTRPDRYELKDSKRRRTLDEGGKRQDGTRKKRRKSGLTKPKDNFKAPNVLQERLTLRSAFDKALFGRGRSSAAVRRRDLPDLTFSEMGFLSKDLSQQEGIQSSSHAVSYKPERGAPSMAEISCYFSREQQEAAQHEESTDVRQRKRDHTRQSPSRVIHQTPAASMSRYIQTSTRSVTKGISTTTPRPQRSITSESTSYFTWSGSRPSSRDILPPCPRSMRGLAPSYSIDGPKPVNAQIDTTTLETVEMAKRNPGTKFVLPMGANRCHSTPSPRTQQARKDTRSNEGANNSHFASSRQLDSARNIDDDSKNIDLPLRKTVATQTSPGLLLMERRNDLEELRCTESNSPQRSRLGLDDGNRLEIDQGDAVDVWQHCPHPKEKRGHILYDIDGLIDCVGADASMRSPMVFPHHQAWATPSHTLTRRPLYPRTEGQIHLFGLRKQEPAQSAGTFRNSNHLERLQQPTLPFGTPSSKRDKGLKAATITSMGRNLWTSPQQLLPSVTYSEEVCPRTDYVPQSPALYNHRYPLGSISLRTEQTHLPEYAVSVRDQLKFTGSASGGTVAPENPTFWRPNKLY